jgi:hypothetical protein
METAIYRSAFLNNKGLLKREEIGTFNSSRRLLRRCGSLAVLLAGLLPMLYPNQAVSPVLAIANNRDTIVHFFSPKIMRPELYIQDRILIAVETMLLELENSTRLISR